MKNCTYCKWANWKRTAVGRLHQSGDGWCQFHYVVPRLPAAFYWGSLRAPTPDGGAINRKETRKEACIYGCREVKPTI